MTDKMWCPQCSSRDRPVDLRYREGCALCDYTCEVEPWLAVAYALSGIDECLYPPKPGFSRRLARLPHTWDVIEARMRELKNGTPT